MSLETLRTPYFIKNLMGVDNMENEMETLRIEHQYRIAMYEDYDIEDLEEEANTNYFKEVM